MPQRPISAVLPIPAATAAALPVGRISTARRLHAPGAARNTDHSFDTPTGLTAKRPPALSGRGPGRHVNPGRAGAPCRPQPENRK